MLAGPSIPSQSTWVGKQGDPVPCKCAAPHQCPTQQAWGLSSLRGVEGRCSAHASMWPQPQEVTPQLWGLPWPPSQKHCLMTNRERQPKGAPQRGCQPGPALRPPHRPGSALAWPKLRGREQGQQNHLGVQTRD